MVKNISTLRSAFSADGIILASALASDTTINYKALYNDASKRYLTQLAELHNFDNYTECVAAIENQDPYERVLNMRALLMHAARQGANGAMNLFWIYSSGFRLDVNSVEAFSKRGNARRDKEVAPVLRFLNTYGSGQPECGAILGFVCQDV